MLDRPTLTGMIRAGMNQTQIATVSSRSKAAVCNAIKRHELRGFYWDSKIKVRVEPSGLNLPRATDQEVLSLVKDVGKALTAELLGVSLFAVRRRLRRVNKRKVAVNG